jgi:D-lactate dehydrogenase (cytochrome)
MSRLPDIANETKKDLDESGITATIVGHVGDGNFHAILLFSNDEELEKIKGLVHRIVERAQEMEGTCTGQFIQ